MPLLDITKPEISRFLTENYHKTALLRQRWNYLNRERLAELATMKHEKGYREADVAAASMRAGLPTITRDHASGAFYHKQNFFRDSQTCQRIALRKSHSIADMGLGDSKEDPRLARPDTDLQPDPKMRPVDPEQREILYKDIPYFGRKVYLNKRQHILPEDRFYFPETTASEYGWRLKDSYFGTPKTAPQFGHVSRF